MRAEVAPAESAGAIALWRRLRAEWLAVVTAAAAVGVPVAAARYLEHRVHHELEPALSRATGVPTRVGGISAGLLGDVTVTDLAVGELFTAERVEAAVALDSLAAGELSPDEIRVTRPRLRAVAGADGDAAWRGVLDRLSRRRGGGGPARPGRRLRRIVVSGGDLVIDVPGLQIRAGDVELHPVRGGVRVVTGAASFAASAGPVTVRGAVARIGADLRLPALAIERAALIGGALTVSAGGAPARLTDVSAVRDGRDRAWRITGAVDDAGVPRPLAVAIAPRATAVIAAGDRIPLAVLDGRLGALGLADARASGQVTVTRGRAALIDAELAVTGATLDHPAIASGDVPLDGAVGLTARLEPGRIEVERATLTRAGVELSGQGWLRTEAGAIRSGELTVALAPADCRRVLDALPAPLVGPLGALAIRGSFAGTARATIDLDAAPGDGVHLAVDLDNRCEVVADPPAADVHALAAVAEHRFPDGTAAPVGPGVGDWVDLAALPRHVSGAFVAAEDARFWDHAGFDLTQIGRSLEIDLREERFARGGSTISQQLVKNAFLGHDRTVARKLAEAVLTWRLEAVLAKEVILARYLNVVELGPGIHGVAAAARHWFGRSPGELTIRQAAFLAALTPAPRTLAARLVAGHRLDPDTARRVDVVVRAMRRAGVISPEAARAAEHADLGLRPAALGR
jgi:hypothetical protein